MTRFIQKPLVADGKARVLLFFPVFFLFYFAAAALVNATVAGLFPDMPNRVSAGAAQLIGLWQQVLINALASVGSVGVFRRYADQRSLFSLGFAWQPYRKYFVAGILAAVGMLLMGTVILMAGGWLVFTGWQWNGLFLGHSLLLMFVVATVEELVFRGYVLNNLLQSLNKWAAWVISAGLFAAIHLGNPGLNYLALTELFVGGLMLGVHYLFKRNLWFSIGLHWAWNFLQGPVLGYQVSGVPLPSLLQQATNGPSWLTGGPFGFEGSVLAILLNGLLILTLVILYRNKKLFHGKTPAA